MYANFKMTRMWELIEHFKAPLIIITHEAKVTTAEMNSKVGFFSKEMEGIHKNQMGNFELIDTVTEIKSPLEDFIKQNGDEKEKGQHA